jgi:hypothetical protein
VNGARKLDVVLKVPGSNRKRAFVGLAFVTAAMSVFGSWLGQGSLAISAGLRIENARLPNGSKYRPVDLGVASPGIGAIIRTPTDWWVAGSFRDVSGEHRPGLWKSADGTGWTRIDTVAATPYGEVSELYAVAADSHGLAAIGMATGGAHGNPRTVSWVLQADGKLHEVAANFELYNGVRQIGVRSISGGPAGFVIFGTRNNRNDRIGATSWTSPAGDDFTIRDDDVALSSGPGEFVQGLDVTSAGGEYVAVGERLLIDGSSINTDGIVWKSLDGVTWQRFSPTGLLLGGPGDQRVQRAAVDGTRVVLAGIQTRGSTVRFLSWSTQDGKRWKRTTLLGLKQSENALSNVTGLWNKAGRIVVSARVGSTLRAVESVDGSRWKPLALPTDLPDSDRARLVVATQGIQVLVGASVFGVTQPEGGGLWMKLR